MASQKSRNVAQVATSILIIIFYPSMRRAYPASCTNELIFGNPSISTCPTANCPPPPSPPVLSTQFVHGRTTKGARQDEWLSNLGFLIDTGGKTASDPASGQKVVQYLGAMQTPGAGTAWTLNTDLVRNGKPGGPNSFGGLEGSGTPGDPGAIGNENGSIGYELDFTNWDADSRAGHGPFTVGQYVHAQGSFTSLSALYFDAAMGMGKAAWDSGIVFNGLNVVKESTIADFTGATASITVGGRHRLGLNFTQANGDMEAIAMRAGQRACFDNASECVSWKDNKLSYTNREGKIVFSIDQEGNAYFAGKVIQNSSR